MRPKGVRQPATAERGLPHDDSASRPQCGTEAGAATPSDTRRSTAAGVQVNTTLQKQIELLPLLPHAFSSFNLHILSYSVCSAAATDK